jgi:hypothetical protein
MKILTIFKMINGDKIIVYGTGEMKSLTQSSNIDLKQNKNFTKPKIKIEE